MLQARPLNQLAVLVFCCQFFAVSIEAQDLYQRQPSKVASKAPQRHYGQESTIEKAFAKPKFNVADYTGPLSQPVQLFSSAKSDLAFQSSATLVQSNDREELDPRLVSWEERVYTWSAPHFYHRRLYFEQVNLERYGIGPAPIARPMLSSTQFYASIVLWPLKMIGHCPAEHEYSLGHQRPGDVAAYQH